MGDQNKKYYFADLEKMSSDEHMNEDMQDIACPRLFLEYNKHMGYVDKLDMLKSIYELDRKSKKWWLRIFWYLLDISLVNAYIIFKNRNTTTKSGKCMTLKDFKLAVCLGLIGADENIPKKGRISSVQQNTFKANVPQEIRYDSCAHMPIHGSSRRCAYYSSTSSPHRTKWICSRKESNASSSF
ncbi:unnamed protein product [Acanthoscelides obtectus]|uniref:PiggyBac transposable element-derived protein domain-containing protein n=1 Tax=Acanthoscelides obtectus TaxID=200917 RepID=A0A9P0LL02_ACAOB|nr:unnamed protein product [Acanthoscelides obtectus]CAK1633651.1 PiggyBac transposable element-derived protein 4 [Acanthoscelides obtectus]